MIKFVSAAIAGLTLGGWAIPLGFAIGIGAIPTFLSAAAGGLVGCWTFLLVGDRVAGWLRARRGDR